MRRRPQAYLAFGALQHVLHDAVAVLLALDEADEDMKPVALEGDERLRRCRRMGICISIDIDISQERSANRHLLPAFGRHGTVLPAQPGRPVDDERDGHHLIGGVLLGDKKALPVRVHVPAAAGAAAAALDSEQESNLADLEGRPVSRHCDRLDTTSTLEEQFFSVLAPSRKTASGS